MLVCGFTFQYGIFFLSPFLSFLSFLVLQNTADAAARSGPHFIGRDFSLPVLPVVVVFAHHHK
jgi:hypothetical protein